MVVRRRNDPQRRGQITRDEVVTKTNERQLDRRRQVTAGLRVDPSSSRGEAEHGREEDVRLVSRQDHRVVVLEHVSGEISEHWRLHRHLVDLFVSRVELERPLR